MPLHRVVLEYSRKLVSYFVVAMFVASVEACAQTAAPAAKPNPSRSAERLALARGQEALKRADLAQARTEFEKAVRFAPNDAEAQSDLGWVLAQQGESDAALLHLRTAVKIAPKNAEAHRTLARILSTRPGDESLSEIRRAVELAPQRADLRDELGTILAQRNQFADAEASYKEALRVDPNFEPALFHLGAVHLRGEQLDQAAAELGKAVELVPQDAIAHYYLAKTFTEQAKAVPSKNADALQELRKAAALKPDWLDAQIELGIACQHAGDSDGAVAAFSAAVKLNPQDAEAYNDLGLALVQRGDAEGSIPKFKMAAQLRPQDGTFRGNLAIAYLQRADFDAAITELEAALKLAPENASLHYNLGLAYKLKDQLDKAVVEFQNAIRLQPDLADAHYTLGILYWQRGEFDPADEELQKAIQSKPDYAEAYYTLGTVLKQQGKSPEAAVSVREAVRLQPDFAGAHTTLAAVLRQLGDADGAAAEAKEGARIAASTNNLQAATFSTNSGKRLLGAGDVDGAIAQFRSAIQSEPKYAAAHYQLALALRQKGEKAEAGKEFQKAAELDPRLTVPGQ